MALPSGLGGKEPKGGGKGFSEKETRGGRGGGGIGGHVVVGGGERLDKRGG